MNIIAPRPKKLSSNYSTSPSSSWTTSDDEACQELQQILASQSTLMEDLNIIRTNNPLPNDRGFVPIYQAVSDLTVSSTTTADIKSNHSYSRPRSFSVGDSRNFSFNTIVNLVH